MPSREPRFSLSARMKRLASTLTVVTILLLSGVAIGLYEAYTNPIFAVGTHTELAATSASFSGTSAFENITSSTGSLLQPATYVIFKIGSTTYAKNETSGAIAYSGSNSYTVIQSAINNAPAYGTVLVKKAAYVLSSTIMLNKSINLVGENDKDVSGSYFVVSTDIPAINVTSNFVTIRYIGLFANVDSYSKGALVIQPATGTILNDVTVTNLEIYRPRSLVTVWSGYGIEVMANKGDLSFTTFRDIRITSGFQYHIYLYADGAGKYANGLLFDNIFMDSPIYGVQFDPRNGAALNSEIFTNTRVQAVSDAFGKTEWIFNISSVASELRDVKVWDIPANKGTVRIHSSSTDTLIDGGALANITDAGTRSIIRNVYGANTENSGSASKSNGQTIAHGLDFTPTYASCTTSNSSTTCSITSIGATTITVGVKDYNGVDVTAAQTIYWRAEYMP